MRGGGEDGWGGATEPGALQRNGCGTNLEFGLAGLVK